MFDYHGFPWSNRSPLVPVSRLSPGCGTGLRPAIGSASGAAFVPAGRGLLATGFRELDVALGGGFPRGILATLEGPASSGRSAIGARLLALATSAGLAALIERADAGGTLYPPALASAGVALERLLVIPAGEPTGIARAVDIVLRSGAFGVVVLPMVALSAQAWTRLAGLAHRTNALVVVLGTSASSELRFFASVRLRTHVVRVGWSGGSGPFGTLAGYVVRAEVLKHKRAAPGKHALVPCATFESGGPALAPPREHILAPDIPDADRLRVRSVV